MGTDQTFHHRITQQIEELEHQIEQHYQELRRHQRAVDTLTNNLAYLHRQKRMLTRQLHTTVDK